MPKCNKCYVLNELVEHLKSEVQFLRAQVERVTAPPLQYNDPPSPDYVGGGQDQFVAYDQFGAKVLMEQDINLERSV